MARPVVFKCSTEEFKKIWLDYLVDKKGNKVSWRKVIKMEEFQDKTGYYRDLYGTKKPMAIGSASYWLNKLGLYEDYVFDYHKNVTKRIPDDTDFLSWSKKVLTGEERARNFNINKYDPYLTYKVIDKICELINYPFYITEQTNYEVLWMNLEDDKNFRDDKSKLHKLFNDIYVEMDGE